MNPKTKKSEVYIMWNRRELKSRGKLAMKANYVKCVITALILSLVTASQVSSSNGGEDGGVNQIKVTLQEASATTGISVGTLAAVVFGFVSFGLVIAVLIKMFISNPLNVGGHNFFMKNADQPASLDAIVEPFKKGHLVNVWLVMLLSDLICALWTLLLIIPGVVKSYEYRMVPYILAENPSIDWRDALATSKQMMSGNKMAAFILDLSFLGWCILGVLTAGILNVFYVRPYIEATNAELYLTLKEQA